MSTVNPLSMSDEDFLKQNGPAVADGEAQTGTGGETSTTTHEPVSTGEGNTETVAGPTEAEQAAEAEALAAQEAADKAAADEAAAAATGETASADQADKQSETLGGSAQTADVTGNAPATTEGNSSVGSSEATASAPAATEPPNYEALYKSIVAPLKANGKTINVQTPEEAIQLMQMGANYTRKMQALAPQRKMLMMLENNGMLDEDQLSFAIDVVKNKNPEAIKKLLKDAGIDPLEIDTTTDANYREGNHRVSDDEAGFVTTLDDLRSTQDGAETIKVINSEWDQASKDALWKNPEVMVVINNQRATGVYARVADEVERQRTLGMIPANMPFIHAYRQIGEQLGKAGQLDDLVQSAQPKPQVKAPVAIRVAPPKPAVTNGAKASAASATRTTPVTAAVKINPLAQSDEDFMKQFSH